MVKRKLISEAQVMQFILDEFNENDIGLKFYSSLWGNDENTGFFSILRRNFTNDRFDIIEEYDEQTYAKAKIRFVPTNISSLNTEFLTHPQMQEITYSPQVEFLVNSDNEVWVTSVREIIESTRTRLMQLEKNYIIKQTDYNTEETIIQEYRGVFTTGEMDYGTNVQINGVNYLMMSLEVNLFLTNFGNFANGQEFTFYHSELKDDAGLLKEFKIPELTWDWGIGIDDEPTQLLSGTSDDPNMASEVKSYPKTKGFALVFEIPIDFRNEFLQELYIESMAESPKIPTIYVDFRTFYDRYNEITKEFERVEITRARNRRAYVPSLNKPLHPMSKGDKLYFNLTLTPEARKWWEYE